MTYLVLETHLSCSVVLDEAGRFLKVANLNYEVGQRVEHVVPLSQPEKKVTPLRAVAAMGTVAACFMLMFSMYWSNYMMPFASIYLSINPEVRMEISKRDTVLNLEGLNEDGLNLIAGYSGQGKTITQATDDLVDRAIAMGFLADGGMVTVDIDSPDEAWFTSTGIGLRQSLNAHLSEYTTVVIEVKQYAQSTDSADPSDVPSEPSSLPSVPASQPSVPSPPIRDSGYGESSYDSQTAPTLAPPPEPRHDSAYGDSAYGIVPSDSPDDLGDSNYQEPSSPDDLGDSNYQEPSSPDYLGDSGYQEPSSSDDSGDSNYQEPSSSDDSGDSNYQEPSSSDDSGDSGYQEPSSSDDSGDSGYEEPSSSDDSGDSGYQEPSSSDDSGDSGYQEPSSSDDSGDSGYQELSSSDDSGDSGYQESSSSDDSGDSGYQEPSAEDEDSDSDDDGDSDYEESGGG